MITKCYVKGTLFYHQLVVVSLYKTLAVTSNVKIVPLVPSQASAHPEVGWMDQPNHSTVWKSEHVSII